MSMVFLATGTCTMGRTTRDKDGNIVAQKPATWDYDPDGGSIAVGQLDPRTQDPIAPVNIFGNWDAAGYLDCVLGLLNPARAVNIPNLKEIVRAAVSGNDADFLCQYCEGVNCVDCIVDEWKREFYLLKTGEQYG